MTKVKISGSTERAAINIGSLESDTSLKSKNAIRVLIEILFSTSLDNEWIDVEVIKERCPKTNVEETLTFLLEKKFIEKR